MKKAIISGLIISFSVLVWAKDPREDFYERILHGQTVATAAFHSGYEPTPIDKYFYYTFVENQPRSAAVVHSGFRGRGKRYDFLERIRDGQPWRNAARYSEYSPTKREVFFLLIREGSSLQSAIPNSGYKPEPADYYYYDVLIQKRSARHAAENRGYTPGPDVTPAFTCAVWFGLRPS